MRKLSEFLAIDFKISIDLGRTLKKPLTPLPANKKTPDLTATKVSESTTLSPNLAAIVICKFCEALICSANDAAAAAAVVAENKENLNPIRFCSEYCRDSFKKILIMKKSNLKVAVQSNSKLSLIMDTSLALTDALKRPGIDSEPKEGLIKWSPNVIDSLIWRRKVEQPTTTTTTELSSPVFETIRVSLDNETRTCIFCGQSGDADSNGPSRLLSIDVNKWSHLNCALWSDEVYETMNGSLVNVDIAFRKCASVLCAYCQKRGASLKCFFPKCNVRYHLICAIKEKCAFNQDKVRVNNKN